MAEQQKSLQEIAELSKPLANWLANNKNPYYSIVITSHDVHLVCDEAMVLLESGQPQD